MGKEVFHTIRHLKRTFTQDQWAEYCNECRHDEKKQIRTTIGKYVWNDFDICLNPEREEVTLKGGAYGYSATIKYAHCGNGVCHRKPVRSFGENVHLKLNVAVTQCLAVAQTVGNVNGGIVGGVPDKRGGGGVAHQFFARKIGPLGLIAVAHQIFKGAYVSHKAIR